MSISPILIKSEVVELLRISERQLEILVQKNQFPRPERIGRHATWQHSAVMRWIELKYAAQHDFHPQLGQLNT